MLRLLGMWALLAVWPVAFAQALSKTEAVALAEKFVAENGYAALPPDKLKSPLDHESIEWSESSGEMLQGRFNSLRPKAIGIRKDIDGEHKRWIVAFDYVDRSRADELCRVVTMDLDGAHLRMEHKSGSRKSLLGFREH